MGKRKTSRRNDEEVGSSLMRLNGLIFFAGRRCATVLLWDQAMIGNSYAEKAYQHGYHVECSTYLKT